MARMNRYSRNMQFPSSICTFCKGPAALICERCSDLYCSEECQAKDWQHHRYICFPKPALIKASADASNSLAAGAALLTTAFQHQRKIPVVKNNSDSNGHGQQHHKINNQSSTTPNYHNKNNQKQLSSNHASSTAATIPLPLLPEANSCVILTGFRSPNRCYIRSCNSTEADKFLLIAKKIDTYGKTALPLTQLPKAHTYAITRLDGVMCRVKILNPRNVENIRVLFCDYGNTAIRQLSELRQISDEIIGLQQHATMIQLRNVDNFTINEQLTQFLAQFEDAQFKVKYCTEDEHGGNAELYHWQTCKLLNDEIVKFSKNLSIGSFLNDSASKQSLRDNGEKTSDESEFRNNCTVKNQQENNLQFNKDWEKNMSSSPSASSRHLESPVLVAPFETHHFKVGKSNFKAVVLDTSCLDFGYIGCIEETDLNHLLSIQKNLKNIVDRRQPYHPMLNEYCIAKYEGDWYRAQVTDVLDTGHYNVVYIDYTNECTLTSEEIRQYPHELHEACKTNLCLIEGLPPALSAKHKEFLKEEVTFNSKVTIDKVKGIDEQIIVIECQSIIDKMRDQGLI